MADAARWYREQRAALDDQCLQAVSDAMAVIQSMPAAAPIVLEDVRRCPVARFPYGVFYRVLDGSIAVLAVYHVSRDPRGWQQRRPQR